MRPLPTKLRQQLANDPYYSKCARFDEECSGRITWELAFTYAGRQINEKWSIIPLCEYHHLGGGLDKNYNRYLALKRATPEELAQYPREHWEQLLIHLK